MTLVADIRRVMLEKGVAQAELARTLGMSASQLSAILRDPEYNFTVRMLRRFAAALDTDLNITIGEEREVECVEADPTPYVPITGGVFTYPASGTVTINNDDIVYAAGDSISFTLKDIDGDVVTTLLGSDPSDD